MYIFATVSWPECVLIILFGIPIFTIPTCGPFNECLGLIGVRVSDQSKLAGPASTGGVLGHVVYIVRPESGLDPKILHEVLQVPIAMVPEICYLSIVSRLVKVPIYNFRLF